MSLIAMEKMGRSSFVDSWFDLDNFKISIRLITEALNRLLDIWLWTPGTQGDRSYSSRDKVGIH